MATTITIDTVDHTPLLVDGYSARRPSRSVQHQILGSNEDAVALRASGLREGRLRVLFEEVSDAEALTVALSNATVAALASTERPSIDMAFVLPSSGATLLTLDPDTRAHWWVEFDYQEISA